MGQDRPIVIYKGCHINCWRLDLPEPNAMGSGLRLLLASFLETEVSRTIGTSRCRDVARTFRVNLACCGAKMARLKSVRKVPGDKRLRAKRLSFS